MVVAYINAVSEKSLAVAVIAAVAAVHGMYLVHEDDQAAPEHHHGEH
jgi:hypothetical protein